MTDSKAEQKPPDLSGLSISELPVAPKTEPSPNPWTEATPAQPAESTASNSDKDKNESESTLSSIDGPQKQDVLTLFDPLNSLEEEGARDAWATAESNPPTRQSPSPPPPPPTKDGPPASEPPDSPPNSGASTASTFPSLSAIAKSFTLPSLARGRPVSMDAARDVPSPATLSSMASKQGETPITEPQDSNKDSEESAEEPLFDFQKFLEQMNTRSAEPVSKYLKSFLSNFAKRTFTVNDQIKIINDFLNFIAARMRECDVWKKASDQEFDNAIEGMEKLVMNRLYDFTFTPQLLRITPMRPVTTDDLERDRVLSQRIALFHWIEEKHLDVPEGEGSRGFIMFAQQELLKINHYKAPRDKVICILNSCKVIFGLIRHLKKDEGADSFVPILIFVVLKANPEHLLSNVEFINRFRNPEKLQSEAGYYLSSLTGAVSFIETMDHTSLSNITQEEFERNVEEAIQSLPTPDSPIVSQSVSEPETPVRPPSKPMSPHAGEESAQPLALPTPSPKLSEDAKRIFQKTGDTISKPLNAIGRIFSDALDGAEQKLTYLPGPFAPLELGRENRRADGSMGSEKSQHWATNQMRQDYYNAGSYPQTPGAGGSHPNGPTAPPIQTPYKPRVRRGPSSGYVARNGSPSVVTPDGTPSRLPPPQQNLSTRPPSAHVSRTPTPNLDLEGVQAEIDNATEQAAVAARETLTQIFPSTDREVISWVLEANDNDLGKSIEALLEMSSG